MLQKIILLLLMCETVTSPMPPNCDGYMEGDFWKPQPCESCPCVSGRKICAIPSCATIIPDAGARQSTVCAIPPPDCDGYAEGDTWEPQPCEYCSCYSGRKICASSSCAILCDDPVPGEGLCCPTCPDVTTTPPPDCDGYVEGDFWEPQPCELCSCVSGNKICASPDCHVPCANPIPGEGACCPTCPFGTTTALPYCDGYAEGDSWEPEPCGFCSCVWGRKICVSPTCVVPCDNPIPGEGLCCPTCPDVSTTLPPLVTLTLDCDGYADGDYWEPQPCEFCSCELGFKACYSPLCAIPCENPIHREGVCCPTCPDVTSTSPPDCDGYAEGDSWEPQPCELCYCVSGSKICTGPDCDVPCANPIPGEGACCPTCPDVTQCKKVKKCRPRSFWNKDKCKCECHPAECLPGYTFNTKKCRCQCRKEKCPDGFFFDRKCCECKCRNYLECEPGQYFSQVTCGCQTGNLD